MHNLDAFNRTIFIIVFSILIIVIIFAVISTVYFIKHEHFVCPKCKNAFKPSVLKFIFSVNAVTGKIIKCPQCGSKEYMEPVKDK